MGATRTSSRLHPDNPIRVSGPDNWTATRRAPPHGMPASAFSSQNVMPISRNMVIAIVRCSRACSCLPVRLQSLPRPSWQWATRWRMPSSWARVSASRKYPSARLAALAGKRQGPLGQVERVLEAIGEEVRLAELDHAGRLVRSELDRLDDLQGPLL
jgi:hypothetical protein